MNSFREGFKQRLFYDASGKTVSEYLKPIKQQRKNSRPKVPTFDKIADDMTKILRTKYPTEKIAISLVQFWLKNLGKGK
jgi:hypothetical protein